MPPFYRIPRTNPPNIPNFVSLADASRTPKNLMPREQRMAEGLSVYDSASAAEAIARQLNGQRGWFQSHVRSGTMLKHHYEVWDEESGNLVATQETEAAALRWIREVQRDNPDLIRGFALVGFDEEGRPQAIAAGEDLVSLVQSARMAK